jgi:hypothetical protein
MKSGYRPKIDTSAELKIDGIQYFQELIGILRWACALGRVDIATEVSLLSSHPTGLSHFRLPKTETQEDSCF